GAGLPGSVRAARGRVGMTPGDGSGRPAATTRQPTAAPVVAVIAAFERADTVGPTVAALHAAGGVDRVIVVDDGSRDGTDEAADGDLLRALLPLAPGFAVETALGIEAVRAGARVAEIELPLEHRPTGRGIAGFGHRGRQGGAVVRALAGRLGGRWLPLGAGLGVCAMAVVALAGLSVWLAPPAKAIGSHPARVVIFAIPGLGWDDVTARQMTSLRRLVSQGGSGSIVAGAGFCYGDATFRTGCLFTQAYTTH